MKLFNYISIVVIVSSLALSGCAKSETKESTALAASATPAATASVDPQTGITSMLDVSALFKTAVEAKDAAQVNKIGPQLEDAWATFEDYIKPNYPDDYLKVENSLTPLTSGAIQDSLDFAILTKLNEDLKTVLEKLKSDLADG